MSDVTLSSAEVILDRLAKTASIAHLRNGHCPEAATMLASELQQLEVLCTRLSQEGDAFQSLCARTANQANIHSSLLAPVRCLPTELLAQIFELATPSDWEGHSIGTKTLAFAQACYVWRMVALGMPQLWNTIHVGAKCPKHGWKKAAMAYLQRSSVLPLAISFDFDTRCGRHLTEDAFLHGDFWSDEAWSALCAQAIRWKHIKLYHLPPHAMHPIGPPLSFPILESVAVGTRETGRIPLDFFDGAPNVKRLLVDYFHTPELLVLPTSWKLSELTIMCGEGEFGYARPSLVPCLDAILACSPTLEYCHITAIGFNSGQCHFQETTFPQLQNLALVGAYHLCTFITAPNLIDVRLDATCVSENSTSLYYLDAFEALVARSSNCPKLRKLTMRHMQQTPDKLIRCLWRLPSLATLHIVDSDGFRYPSLHALATEDLVRALTRTPLAAGSFSLLPNLTSLSLMYNGACFVDLDEEEESDKDMRIAINKMVASRSRRFVEDGMVLRPLEHFETDCRGVS
ncbi:hypothetical protein HDZ31DRAFT_41541 [Schizophyllum fasciatum]